MNGPILITGPYRSGTTWVSLLLQNHPSVNVALHYTNWFRENHAHASDAVEYARKRFGVEPEAPQLLKYTYPCGSSHMDWFVALHTIFGMDVRVGEKMQLEWSAIPRVLGESSEAQALLILRDPRSILCSFREYTYHDDATYLQAAFVCLSALQHATRLSDELPPERFHVLRYEDIATDTETELRRGVRWLGLDWPGADVMLSTEGWSEVPGSRWEDRSSFGRVDEDFDVGAAVHRWKGNLSTDERRFVEWVCWDEMQAWGYEPSHNTRPIAAFTPLMREARANDGVAEMLDRFLRTGEGTEAFPEDPTDSSTWREPNREGVA